MKTFKTPKMTIFERRIIEVSCVKFFQRLRGCNVGPKLVQTDQGYQSHQLRPIWTPTCEDIDHIAKSGPDPPPKKIPT